MSIEMYKADFPVSRRLRDIIEILRTGEIHRTIVINTLRTFQEVPEQFEVQARADWLDSFIIQLEKFTPANLPYARDIITRLGIHLEMRVEQWQRLMKLNWFYCVDGKGERRKIPDYLKESRFKTGRIRSSAYVERKLKRTFTGTSLRNREGEIQVCRMESIARSHREPTYLLGRRTIVNKSSCQETKSASDQSQETSPRPKRGPCSSQRVVLPPSRISPGKVTPLRPPFLVSAPKNVTRQVNSEVLVSPKYTQLSTKIPLRSSLKDNVSQVTPLPAQPTRVDTRDMLPDTRANLEQYFGFTTTTSKQSENLSKPPRRSLATLVAIDIEGQVGQEVEVAIIIYGGNLKDVAAKLYHLLPQDVQSVEKEAPFCHGIDVKELAKMKLWTRKEMMRDIGDLIKFLVDPCIISADESENSDVWRFSREWDYPYVNIPLPKWEKRVSHHIHVQIVKEKMSGYLEVADVRCPFLTLHQIRVDKKTRETGGAHCGLADTLELVRYVHDLNIHDLISRASRDNPAAQLSSFC